MDKIEFGAKNYYNTNTMWEARHSAERPGPLPTTLTLFGRTQPERTYIHERWGAYQHLRGQERTSRSAIQRFLEESKKREQRLRQTSSNLLGEKLDLASSEACGAAYLKMLDELPAYGASEGWIEAFFLDCLVISLHSTGRIAKDINEDKPQNPRNAAADVAEDMELINRYLSFDSHPWFAGSESEWTQFAWDRCNFSRYLFPKIKDRRMSERIRETINEKGYTGAVFISGLPDWVLAEIDDHKPAPTRSVIEEEMHADHQQNLLVEKQLKDVDTQIKYIHNRDIAKVKKVALGVARRAQEVFPAITTFPDLVLYLGIADLIPQYHVPLSQVETLPGIEILTTMLPLEQVPAQAIEQFIASETTAFSKENAALWIENILRQGGVIESAQDPLSNVFVAHMDTIIAMLGDQKRPADEDKRSIPKALMFDIRTLLKLASPDDLAYLQELMHELQGIPLEPVIWEIAEIVSRNTQQKDNAPIDRDTEVRLNHIKTFAKAWIAQHHQWALGNLKETATRINVTQPQATNEVSVEGPETGTIEIKEEQELAASVQALEETAKEYETGNLAGWRILYSEKGRTDTKSLVEIPGVTLDERTEALREFLGKNSIPCTEEANVIIDTFDTLVTEEGVTKHIRPRYELKGNKFKRYRKGEIRLLYTIDEDTRQLIFYIEQKKDWKYSFQRRSRG